VIFFVQHHSPRGRRTFCPFFPFPRDTKVSVLLVFIVGNYSIVSSVLRPLPFRAGGLAEAAVPSHSRLFGAQNAPPPSMKLPPEICNGNLLPPTLYRLPCALSRKDRNSLLSSYPPPRSNVTYTKAFNLSPFSPLQQEGRIKSPGLLPARTLPLLPLFRSSPFLYPPDPPSK